MRDEASMTDDEERVEGRPHAALCGIGRARLKDGGASALHGSFKPKEDGAALFFRRLCLDGRADRRIFKDGLAEFFRRHLARDITGGVPTHAISDDEEVPLLIDEEAVLVMFADAADIGRGPKKNR